LRSEIDRISAATNYNGTALISSKANRFGTVSATSGNVLWIDANSSVGVDSITISINTVTSASISSASFTTGTISSQAEAKAAISEVDLAICSINTIRTDIGAYVNRLEHAVNNLNVSETNQTAAESLIRDADFAEETSKFTKNQILLKSSTAMLAQSNILPKSILTLMKK
jgi:flagellin